MESNDDWHDLLLQSMLDADKDGNEEEDEGGDDANEVEEVGEEEDDEDDVEVLRNAINNHGNAAQHHPQRPLPALQPASDPSPLRGSQPQGITDCVICLEPLNCDMAALHCGHVFHVHCLEQQNEYKPECAVCRKKNARNYISLFLEIKPRHHGADDYGKGHSRNNDDESGGMQRMSDSEKVCSLRLELERTKSMLKREKDASKQAEAQMQAVQSKVDSLEKQIKQMTKNEHMLQDREKHLQEEKSRIKRQLDTEKANLQSERRVNEELGIKLKAHQYLEAVAAGGSVFQEFMEANQANEREIIQAQKVAHMYFQQEMKNMTSKIAALENSVAKTEALLKRRERELSEERTRRKRGAQLWAAEKAQRSVKKRRTDNGDGDGDDDDDDDDDDDVEEEEGENDDEDDGRVVDDSFREEEDRIRTLPHGLVKDTNNNNNGNNHERENILMEDDDELMLLNSRLNVKKRNALSTNRNSNNSGGSSNKKQKPLFEDLQNPLKQPFIKTLLPRDSSSSNGSSRKPPNLVTGKFIKQGPNGVGGSTKVFFNSK